MKYDEALLDFNKSIEIDGNNPNPYINRAFVYGALKKYDLAINDINKLIDMDEGNSLMFYVRGNTYKEMGKF